jgi:hypothetical protein
MRRRVWIALGLLGLAPGAACFSLPGYLELPEARLDKPVAGVDGRGREVVISIPFADLRPSPALCGKTKTVLAKDGKTLSCSGPEPGRWIAELLAEELRATGFVTPETATSDDAIRIEGRLERLFVEPVIGKSAGNLMECDIEVTLVATNGRGLRAERRFFAKRRIPWADVRMISFYRAAAAKSARWAVTEMVRAIDELVDRYGTRVAVHR